MKTAITLTAIMFTTLTPCFAATAPCSGTFEIGITPGEGRPKYEVLQNIIEIRKDPSSLSPLIDRVDVEKHTEFEFEDIRFRTTNPSKTKLKANTTLAARSFGCIKYLSRDNYYSGGENIELEISANQEIEYLQYRAEGACFIRVGGSVFEANTCPVTGVEEPKTELWIKTTIHGVKGWVLIDNISAKESCRYPYNCS